MTRENISSHLTATIQNACFSSRSQQELESAIRQLTKSQDKLYAARVLDHYKQQINRQMKEDELVCEKEQRKLAQAYSENPFVQTATVLQQYRNMQGYHLNRLVQQLNPQLGPIYQSPEELAEQQKQTRKTQQEDRLLRVTLARQAISLTDVEQAQLYPDISHLYQQQVNNRKWYQHGAFAVALGILLLPLSPLIYYLWKKDREEEIIQPNLKTEIEYTTAKSNRKAFKQAVNQTPKCQGTFIIEKEQEVDDKKIPAYITKYKKERDKFFSENRFFPWSTILEREVQLIKDSREKDREIRFTLGIG
jgi:hypothetical protein